MFTFSMPKVGIMIRPHKLDLLMVTHNPSFAIPAYQAKTTGVTLVSFLPLTLHIQILGYNTPQI